MSRGLFLERRGNLTDPKSYLEIKVSRKVGCVLASDEVHFVIALQETGPRSKNRLRWSDLNQDQSQAAQCRLTMRRGIVSFNLFMLDFSQKPFFSVTKWFFDLHRMLLEMQNFTFHLDFQLVLIMSNVLL